MAAQLSEGDVGDDNDPIPTSSKTVDADEIEVLRTLVEGTANSTGNEFFRLLVQHLAAAIDVPFAFVAEFADVNTRVRTLAYWSQDRIADNVEFDLQGTPCQDVVHGSLCHHPMGVKAKFPLDHGLVDLGIESYLGVPLRDRNETVLGHLAVFDHRPMSAEPRRLYTFKLFAERAAAELIRLRDERRISESERRYRDLYEEAPIAYVAIDRQGHFQDVNRRTSEILGFERCDLEGKRLIDFCADSAAGIPRAHAMIERCFQGDMSSGIEIEMRAATGRPVWVRVTNRPMAGSGGQPAVIRSIWIDITERVLAEADKNRLQEQNIYLQEEIKAAHDFEEIIAQSRPMTDVLESIMKVAATDASVLITGETGTGKELVARAIHSHSKRKHRPLIKVNCAALPASLIESELFGHEKGAFTGAISRRLGRFELASGGTLFLDEVGEIPMESQAKLLRVLQEREFERVGGAASIKADVRIIAATNRDLLAAINEKTFREDLYYRLNVFPVSLPPLRERKEDLPLLVQFLTTKFASQIGKRIESINQEAMERLKQYSWPGNIRELENVLERAVILCRASTLEIPAGMLSTRESDGAEKALDFDSMARDHLLRVLRQTAWIIDGPRGAAKILGLHPNTLRSRLKKLGIRRADHEIS